jgi:mono/diheme cytochrome c family protein
MSRFMTVGAERFAIAGLAAFVLGWAATARPQETAPPGDAVNGKRIYLADGCFECHGHVGQGGAFLGPAPGVAATQLPYDTFRQQLREPSNNMPAYAEVVLPDKEVADIYAYLQSLPGPREAKDLPAILAH